MDQGRGNFRLHVYVILDYAPVNSVCVSVCGSGLGDMVERW